MSPSHHGHFPAQYGCAWPCHSSLLSLLLPSPSFMGICGQWQRGGQGSTGTAASMPVQFCLEVQVTFLALPQPQQSPEDCSKAARNVAVGDKHWPRGLGDGGSFQEPQASTACGTQPRALWREALQLPQPPKTSVVMSESPDPSRDHRKGCSCGRYEEKYCILQGQRNGGHHPYTTTMPCI